MQPIPPGVPSKHAGGIVKFIVFTMFSSEMAAPADAHVRPPF